MNATQSNRPAGKCRSGAAASSARAASFPKCGLASQQRLVHILGLRLRLVEYNSPPRSISSVIHRPISQTLSVGLARRQIKARAEHARLGSPWPSRCSSPGQSTRSRPEATPATLRRRPRGPRACGCGRCTTASHRCTAQAQAAARCAAARRAPVRARPPQAPRRRRARPCRHTSGAACRAASRSAPQNGALPGVEEVHSSRARTSTCRARPTGAVLAR